MFFVSLQLLCHIRLSWCFSQHEFRKWHDYMWVFWTCVQFVFVPCCNICVMGYACCVCLGEIESTFNVSFKYLSLIYFFISLALTLSLYLRPWLQQARMRIAAHSEAFCVTEESGWSHTLCCLPKYALWIVYDNVCRHTHSHNHSLPLSHTHTLSWWRKSTTCHSHNPFTIC